MIIDSHQHFWKSDPPFDHAWLHEPKHEPICHDYLPNDLKSHLKMCGIDKSVFVQTQHNVEENRWVLKLAEQNDFIAGVVGWPTWHQKNVKSNSANSSSIRNSSASDISLKANRMTTSSFARTSSVAERSQKHKVPFDLLFFTQHLKHAVTLGQSLPELPMVIDHLSKPKIKDRKIDEWKKDLQAAAKFPNIYCKLSGMVTEADWKNWKPADLKPYVDVVLKLVLERCMYGSDWPVCELRRQLRNCIFRTERSLRDHQHGRTNRDLWRYIAAEVLWSEVSNCHAGQLLKPKFPCLSARPKLSTRSKADRTDAETGRRRVRAPISAATPKVSASILSSTRSVCPT